MNCLFVVMLIIFWLSTSFQSVLLLVSQPINGNAFANKIRSAISSEKYKSEIVSLEKIDLWIGCPKQMFVYPNKILFTTISEISVLGEIRIWLDEWVSEW